MFSAEKMPKKTESEKKFLEDLENRFEKAEPVKAVADKLSEAGFEPYLVGGCLRDLLIGRTPKDWDITTNAKPEEILKIFPDAVYENKFGTVAVKTEAENPAMKIVEVTTFRKEGKYTDKRHPDEITFAKTAEEDLSRRDFTVNAMAYFVSTGVRRAVGLVDPFGGREDLEKKIIRAVGEPAERFREDALRLMRAVRLAARLDFSIEAKTVEAVRKEAGLLEYIAKERIADELSKLLMTEKAADGVRQMQELGLLRYVLRELEEGVGMEQNKHHLYTIFEHNLKSLEYAAQKKFPLELRLASLLHDVGKAQTRVWKNDPRGEKELQGKKGDWTFYQHQYVGERMVLEMLGRLKFSKKMIEKVALMVREHMFVYDPEVVTERGVRRLVHRVGPENIDDLFLVRQADRIGSGVKKAEPYRLRHLRAMIEKAKQTPLSPKMLKINGNEVMEITGIDSHSPQAPRIGKILQIVLDEVIDDPKKNISEQLRDRVKELAKLTDKKLDELSATAKESVKEVQERIDEAVMKKYFVE